LQSIACFAGLIEFTVRLFDEPGSKEQSGSLTRLAAKNSPDQSGKERQSTRIIKKLTAKRKKSSMRKCPCFFGPLCRRRKGEMNGLLLIKKKIQKREAKFPFLFNQLGSRWL